MSCGSGISESLEIVSVPPGKLHVSGVECGDIVVRVSDISSEITKCAWQELAADLMSSVAPESNVEIISAVARGDDIVRVTGD